MVRKLWLRVRFPLLGLGAFLIAVASGLAAGWLIAWVIAFRLIAILLVLGG